MTRPRSFLVMGAAVVAASTTMAGIGAAAKPPTELARFTTPGTYTWTVPPKVSYVTFDAFGAQGGDVSASGIPLPTLIATGGDGAEAVGTFSVTAGQVFVIVVGGQGQTAVDQSRGLGGFNGGGNGEVGGIYSGSDRPTTTFYGGGGGGGASDVRAAGGTLSDRILVAGGGGGAGGDPGAPAFGGGGGGLTGSDGTGNNGGLGGTQTSGGGCPLLGGSSFGSFGVGGNASGAGGGGGGGYWGGAGGCTSPSVFNGGNGSRGQGSGGGGGSGLIPPSGKKTGGSFPGAPSPSADGLVIVQTR